MGKATVLLVLGDQAKTAAVADGSTCGALMEEFCTQFPNQFSVVAPSILQVWDKAWQHWVDVGNTRNIYDGDKVRLIQKSSIMPCLGNLSPETCAFFCCDMQERFKPAIAHFDDIANVANRLLQGANLLDIPIFVTEQYPKGLLHTVKDIDISNAKAVIEKTVFSMMVPEMEAALKEHREDLRSVILMGVEAHVCVQQTALDLLERGIEVHIIADATSSRSVVDRMLAFSRLRNQGAFITTAETVLLQLVKDKNHPKFKEIQGIIKVTPPQNGILSIQSSL